jgi:hypothetical protein
MSAISIRRTFRIVATSLLTLLGASCQDSLGPVPAGSLVVVSGDAQSTLPGGQVPRPLVVRAVDAAGVARPGVLIHWSGSGSTFATDTSRTDSEGKAFAIWLLGSRTGGYSASATVDSQPGTATFAATADPNSLILTAMPDTVRFNALDDTATIRIRVRSTTSALDTLIDPRGWSGHVNDVAAPANVGGGRMVLKSVKNGISNQWVFFGTLPAPFVVRVQQTAVDVRILPLDPSQSARDTIPLGADTTLALTVMPVDARGRAVAGSVPPADITWSSSDPSVATITNGVLRGVADGATTISATYDAPKVLRSTVRVWTIRPTAIAAGGGSVCALLDDGRRACWGFRDVGSGSGVTIALAPELRTDGPAFTAISLAALGACGLSQAGAAYCWGQNSSGQLGTGSAGPYTPSPVAVSGNITFASIAAGAVTSCGLTSAGKAWCWGNGYAGALGDGTYGNSCSSSSCARTPTPVSGGLTFSQISKGEGGHACAIATDGRGYCWGENRYGQLGSPPIACAGFTGGDAATNDRWCSTVPVEIGGGRRYKSISAGIAHACAVTTDGAMYCWGSNLNAVVGVPELVETINSFTATPLAVAPSRRFKSVFSGRGHVCAIDTDDAAWCWGSAFIGQLGTGVQGSSTCLNGPCERAPVRVAGGLSFRMMAIGAAHTCGLTLDNVAYCWGSGGTGALGTGGTANQLAPIRVAFQRR